MKEKKKKTKLKKDRSINSFFQEHVKGTSEVESRVKMKKTVTARSPYETESDSDSGTKSGNVGLGVPSKTVDVNSNRSRNHTLLISVNGAEERFPIILKERTCQTWSSFLTNLKDIAGIPNRETLLITYQ